MVENTKRRRRREFCELHHSNKIRIFFWLYLFISYENHNILLAINFLSILMALNGMVFNCTLPSVTLLPPPLTSPPSLPFLYKNILSCHNIFWDNCTYRKKVICNVFRLCHIISDQIKIRKKHMRSSLTDIQTDWLTDRQTEMLLILDKIIHNYLGKSALISSIY